VFRTPGGTPHDPDNWTKRVWNPLRKRAGLRRTIGLHSLRHTFASLLIDQGENPKYVSRRLGHASPAFTLSVYAHCFRETSERAMGRLQGAIRAAKRRQFGVVGG
jgi:integrase